MAIGWTRVDKCISQLLPQCISLFLVSWLMHTLWWVHFPAFPRTRVTSEGKKLLRGEVSGATEVRRDTQDRDWVSEYNPICC